MVAEVEKDTFRTCILASEDVPGRPMHQHTASYDLEHPLGNVPLEEGIDCFRI